MDNEKYNAEEEMRDIMTALHVDTQYVYQYDDEQRQPQGGVQVIRRRRQRRDESQPV